MKKEMIARAWKDPEFRARLTASERQSIPECPSGIPMTELGEDEMLGVVGGRMPKTACVHEATCAPL